MSESETDDAPTQGVKKNLIAVCTPDGKIICLMSNKLSGGKVLQGIIDKPDTARNRFILDEARMYLRLTPVDFFVRRIHENIKVVFLGEDLTADDKDDLLNKLYKSSTYDQWVSPAAYARQTGKCILCGARVNGTIVKHMGSKHPQSEINDRIAADAKRQGFIHEGIFRDQPVIEPSVDEIAQAIIDAPEGRTFTKEYIIKLAVAHLAFQIKD